MAPFSELVLSGVPPAGFSPLACLVACRQVSFGPTIDGAHSPDERVNIPSVGKFWQLVLATLEGLADEKE